MVHPLLNSSLTVKRSPKYFENGKILADDPGGLGATRAVCNQERLRIYSHYDNSIIISDFYLDNQKNLHVINQDNVTLLSPEFPDNIDIWAESKQLTPSDLGFDPNRVLFCKRI